MNRTILLFSFAIILSGCQKEVYHTINVSANPSEGGSVSPSSESVLAGTSVILKATPKSEYVFTGWSGAIAGAENPKTVTVTQDMNVTANFELRSYPLTVTVHGEGTVTERAVSFKSEYKSGTVVELTAEPSEHWKFDHWEGDVEGNDNPVQITVSTETSVKALFTKNKYTFNVKTVGPGVVDEYIDGQTKASVEYGAKIRLEAVPYDGAVFKGWSGGLSGTEKDISFTPEDNIDIVATFEAKRYDLPDLYSPTSVRKAIYYGVQFPDINSINYCALDYNLDGYIDIVTCIGYDGDRLPIQFYQGQKDGSFIIDEVNSNKFDGLIWWRKSLYGDFNGDGLPDICFVGHGWDEEPWPGEYPILLLSSGNGQYTEHRFEGLIGYYHGSAAGDFDNDGDLDIVLIDHGVKSKILENDGVGNMTINSDLLNFDVIYQGMYTCEFFDIDHDGYLDLFVGGDDGYYINQTCVFWGNGKTFNNDDYVRLPGFVPGWGVILDYIFYDLDGDGQEEIINVRTGNGTYGQESYIGWNLQIFSFDGKEFHDVTQQFIKQKGFEKTAVWLCKIYIEEINGDIYLVGLDAVANKHKLFKLKNGLLERCEEKNVLTEGICIYTDGFGEQDGYLDLGYKEDSYSGPTSIHFYNWPIWHGYAVDYPDWIDFSPLVKNQYYLEVVLK